MTERPDASQGVPSESSFSASGTAWVPSRTLARLGGAMPATRRTAVGRVVFAIVVVGIAIPLIVLAAQRAGQSVNAWLDKQETYQLRFDEIELRPAPPAWIKSGKTGLLAKVREQANWPDQISVLRADLDALSLDLQRVSPWVRGVDRRETAYPNRLTFHVRYREPVAWVRICGLRFVLDRDGVVLPNDDLALEKAGHLFEISGLLPQNAPASAYEARPGHAWKRTDDRDSDAVVEAARLAEFFRLRSSGASKGGAAPFCRMFAIHATSGGLYAQTVERTMILWGPGPGFESAGEPTAEEKWRMLREWAENQNDFASVQVPRFLGFDRGRVVVRGG